MKANEKVKTIQQISENIRISLLLWNRSASDDQKGAAMNSMKGRMPISDPG